MFHKLLGEERGHDLERVTSQSRKGLHIETTRNAHRCSRSETASEKPCSRSETLAEKSCSRSETVSQKPSSRSGTLVVEISFSPRDTQWHFDTSKTRQSCESLEQVADDDLPMQLRHEFFVCRLELDRTARVLTLLSLD